MKLKQRKPARRAAFTLIELLIVIAIIAILVSLLSAAVIRALNKGNEVVCRNDITELSNAISTFKQKFGVNPPSRLRLGINTSTYNFTPGYEAQFSTDSIQFIQHCFPRFADNWAINNNANYWGWPIPANPGYVDLEGEQVLVFCLGGLQVNNSVNGVGVNGVQGFSTNPKDPMTLPPNSDSIGPFFDFNAKSIRLISLNAFLANVTNPTPPPTPAGQFFVYLDPWKRPFAYFSSGKRRNNYNAYYNPSGPAAAKVSDCFTLGVWPYIDPNGNYLNSDTYQIISAGPDQVFGQGSNLPLLAPGQTVAQANLAWSPQLSQTSRTRLDITYVSYPNGLDDFSNFYEKALGIGQ
jgi:prepilin-type N-terminal cleavage/methylation domain-containing protein